MLRDTKESFGVINKLFHWSMALMLTGLFGIGVYMVELDYYDSLYHTLPWWHKSVGLLVLFLLLLRFIWKIGSTSPDPLKAHRKWQILLAHLIQKLFYLLILLITLSGYFISTAKGKSIEFFNLFDVPAIFSNIKEQRADLIGETHEILAFLLAAFVVLHILAALKHHFIDKDETLKRML